MARYYKLLNTLLEDTSLLPEDKQVLIGASQDIRNAIKAHVAARIRNAQKDLPVEERIQLEPRFRRQGSFVYHTINKPAHVPPQQMDLDDGCYFPMTLVENKPQQFASVLFKVVEEALVPLCKEHGWKMQPMNACIRVGISKDMHIDIPIYAIPDDQFGAIVEVMEAMSSNVRAFSEPPLIDKDKVNLAHRKEGWKVSDPVLVKNWVLAQLDAYKEQIRSVWRLMKAWRDQQELKLSSLYLMACVADIYDHHYDDIPQRIDEAFAFVVDKMPHTLRKVMPSPGDATEKPLSQRIDEDDPNVRSDAQAHFLAMGNDLKGLERVGNAGEARSILVRYFGERVTDDLTQITIPQQPPETARNTVLGVAPISQELPDRSQEHRFG